MLFSRYIADVAWTVLRLKDEAKLTSSKDAIAFLDQRLPGEWRERFPLPVDDRHAQKLIEQLIQDAADVRPQQQVVDLLLERRVEKEAEGIWKLYSRVSLPDVLQSKRLAMLFGISAEDLPRTAELVLSAGNQRQSTSLRRLAGRDSYRVEKKPWGMAGTCAADEHVLHLLAPDGRAWSASLPKASVLDEELPWLFSAEKMPCLFLRQGSGSIAFMKGMLAVPMDWNVTPDTGSSALRIGELNSPSRQLWSVDGTVRATDEGGHSYRMRMGQAGAVEESFEWSGNRYWLDFVRPSVAYKGPPKVFRVSDEGLRRAADGSPGFFNSGTSASASPLGPVLARYPAHGDVRLRIPMVVLPQNARLEVECQNASTGTLRMVGWGAVQGRVLTARVGCTSRADGADLALNLRAEGERTPESVEVEVLWRHTTIPVRLSLPFPAKGVRAYDEQSQELRTGALLAVTRLMGTRLAVLAGQQSPRITLEISGQNGGRARTYVLRSLPGAVSLEVRLQDYATDIQHLLSADDNPDASARAVVRIGGTEHFRLEIARFGARLIRGDSGVSLDTGGFQALDPETLASLPVLALRLERPGALAFPWRLHASAADAVQSGEQCHQVYRQGFRATGGQGDRAQR